MTDEKRMTIPELFQAGVEQGKQEVIEKLNDVVNEVCSCGGRGFNENECPACRVWHLTIRPEFVHLA